MTRTQSTIIWGLALLAAAVVLAWKGSIPWALAAAGLLSTVVGIAIALQHEASKHAAEQRTLAQGN